MNDDFSSKALFHPGDADDLFAFPDDFPAFDVRGSKSYCRANAIWLAEFSRLIYRGAGRDAILVDRKNGWREDTYFEREDTQAALYVNDGFKCAVLAFRGTLGLADIVSDERIVATEWDGNSHVHIGFKVALEAVWKDIAARLSGLSFPVFFTGHSLGAALATLAASRCLLDANMRPPEALYTFGSPRVGDAAFGATLRGLFHCRVVDDQDLVTNVPPAFSLFGQPVYKHCGQMHRVHPDGHMEIHPQDFDVVEFRKPLAGVLDFVGTFKRLIMNEVEAAENGRPLPAALSDHTPVNYVARLERTAPEGAGPTV